MKTKNRMLAALLTLAMVLTMLPISAFAENDLPATNTDVVVKAPAKNDPPATNTLEIVGIVNWVGDGNQQDKRPEKITVRLLANNTEHASQEVKAHPSGLWPFSFDNLPASDAQGNIDYTITVDEIPEYTTKVEKKSDTLFVITNTLNGTSDKPGYTVTFDANVPANASTTCTGSMDDQSFGYYENKPLSTNGYSLPGYDFLDWNTKADGTGKTYTDGEPVEKLSETGGTVTLYARWSAKSYEIFFDPGEIGGYVHSQRAYFDQPDTLEVYSDEAFGWDPGGKVLHGWAGTGYTTFYDDGASFVNLCGDPLPDGSLADKELDAQWVQGGQIIVAVTKDGVPQSGLADKFSLIDGAGTKFSVEITYKNGKYIFDTSLASAPGIGRAPLPEGEYTLRFSFSDPSYSFIIYPEASAKIAYGADSAVNVVFDYYTVDLQKDPVYTVPHNIKINGAYGISVSGFLVLGWTKLTIRTTDLDPGYIFDRYTADGVTPIWENGDPTKAVQTIQIRGKTTITAHIMPRPKLTVTVIDQKYTYNGGLQGPGDKIYASQAEIAQVVRAEGLRPGDYIASIILDGQGKDVGRYSLSYGFLLNVKNSDGDNVESDYDIEFVNGTMIIEPAELTVTTGSASKVYDGSPLTEESAFIKGLIDNTATAQQGGGVVIVETAAIKATGSQTNAGTSQNTYEIDWGETKASNYKITEKLGTLTVNPKPVTVTANDASKTYGEDDPDLTATTDGLLGSDTVSYTLSRETGENVGTYVITPTGEASQGNYTVSFAPGTFTIEKAPLTLGLSIEGWTEGETANAPVLTGNTGNGAVTYEYKLKTADEAAYGKAVPTAAGDYTVRATVEETSNYLSGETTADFTISAAPAPVTITYEAKDSSGNTVQAVTWQKGSGKTIDLTIKRSEDDHLTYSLFGSLEIGGVTVGSANYDTAEGSLKLSVKPEYLETLSVGDHTVKVNFQDGSATVKLTVKAAAENPKTGDESIPALWNSLMFLSVAAMFVLLLYARKRKTEK